MAWLQEMLQRGRPGGRSPRAPARHRRRGGLDAGRRAPRRRARHAARRCGATATPCTWRCWTTRRDRRPRRSPCPTGRFPSIGRLHPPALRLERTIRDLYGLEPEASPDARRWLDHGRWGVRQPLGSADTAPAAGDAYAFHPAEGPPLHQIPVGPVHAGIIEPGHFRFTANGETVVRLEERLGYVHKGIDGLMRARRSSRRRSSPAASPATARSPMRIAFARAVEAALGHRAAAARGLAARADGGARAPRQPLRRHRRHLQRRLVLADPRPLRHPARARAARGRHLLRPSPDDGPRRARRRRGRSRQGRRRAACAR